MSSFPLISHRLFVEAIGQEDSPRPSRLRERPKPDDQRAREIRVDILSEDLAAEERKSLVSRALSANGEEGDRPYAVGRPRRETKGRGIPSPFLPEGKETARAAELVVGDV